MRIYKLIDEAMQLEEKGENDKALEVWKMAASLDPEIAKVQNGLGISLYVHGEKEEGLEHLRHAIRVNPLAVETHFVLGRFLLDEGNAKEALPELETAIEIRPHFASCEEALGTAYEALGKEAEGLAHWRKAHQIDPASTSATLGVAWILATAPDASERNGKEAVQMAESARDREPDNAEVLDTLGAAYAEDGRFKDASAAVARALALAKGKRNQKLVAAIQNRQFLYGKNRAFHGARAAAALQPVTSKVQSTPEGK